MSHFLYCSCQECLELARQSNTPFVLPELLQGKPEGYQSSEMSEQGIQTFVEVLVNVLEKEVKKRG